VKRLSYTEDARCLKVKWLQGSGSLTADDDDDDYDYDYDDDDDKEDHKYKFTQLSISHTTSKLLVKVFLATSWALMSSHP